MAIKKKRKKKSKSAGFDLTPVVIVLGILALLFTIYIIYRISTSERHFFANSLLPLFAGLLMESFRIADSWKNVVGGFVTAYAASLIAFLPGKREYDYNFENHIGFWPYFFLFMYLLFFAIFNKEKVTAKLTEGITLLLSVSFLYWLIDLQAFRFNSIFLIVCAILSLPFIVFSVVHSFTNIHLSNRQRLWLSIWSTIVVFVISIDNIYKVYNQGDIESSKYFSYNALLAVQYFFLGISAVYIMQNFILLAGFLPQKNSNYKNDLKENIKLHVERYSNQQVDIISALCCICYASSVYTLNYCYDILPRNTMIWLVIFSFPFVLFLLHKFLVQQKAA